VETDGGRREVQGVLAELIEKEREEVIKDMTEAWRARDAFGLDEEGLE
jgi:hypothetical protein